MPKGILVGGGGERRGGYRRHVLTKLCYFTRIFFFFWRAIRKCRKESHTHTQRKVNHDMERKQYIYIYKKNIIFFLPFFFF